MFLVCFLAFFEFSFAFSLKAFSHKSSKNDDDSGSMKNTLATVFKLLSRRADFFRQFRNKLLFDAKQLTALFPHYSSQTSMSAFFPSLLNAITNIKKHIFIEPTSVLRREAHVNMRKRQLEVDYERKSTTKGKKKYEESHKM